MITVGARPAERLILKRTGTAHLVYMLAASLIPAAPGTSRQERMWDRRTLCGLLTIETESMDEGADVRRCRTCIALKRKADERAGAAS